MANIKANNGNVKPNDRDRIEPPTAKHYFKHQPEHDRFCEVCGEYITSELHYRTGEPK